MLQKILLILLVVVLIWIGIKIIVRAFPAVFNKSGLRSLSGGSGGSSPIIYGQSVKDAGILFFFFNLLPALLPAAAKREQANILKKELGYFRARKKSLKDPTQYLQSLAQIIDEKAEEVLDRIAGQEFDFAPFRLEIQKLRKGFAKFVELYMKTDKLLATCFDLLAKAGEHAETDDDLNTLSAMEKDFNDYKLSKFEYGDVVCLNKLYEELLKEQQRLSDYLGAGTGDPKTTKMPDKNYYEILDLQPSASLDEIKSAYRKLAIKYHPDVKTAEMNKVNDPEVRKQVEKAFDEMFKDINQAYEILSDSQQRADYDAKL